MVICMDGKDDELVLVLGATGYVGSRLVTRLLQQGHRVRAAARSLHKLRGRKWAQHENIELIEMDMRDHATVVKALDGVTTVFYLVHSMNPDTKNFAESDRVAAQSMVAALNQSSARHVIYLGGLGETNESLSKHLRSRAEVSAILHSSQVPTTTLRAAMIIGSGSASFEILRYLVDRLPLMVTPRWVHTKSQPIAIRNVLVYLENCVGNASVKNKVLDIGGSEIVTYEQLMRKYASRARLNKRTIIPVPVFSPKLSSYWIHLVTPVPAYIARPLAEGLSNSAVCHDDSIRSLIPQQLLSCDEAISLALNRIQHYDIESHWTDAGEMRPVEWYAVDDPEWAGGTIYEDRRKIIVKGTPEQLWDPIVKLGGRTGYYYGNWMWWLRGVLDKLFGGVGLRRGRRHPAELSPGDALDFWRVKEMTAPETLLLVAEMKLPGEATLQFKIRRVDETHCEIEQIARFLPVGLGGILYWWAVSPLHELVFNGMLTGIIRAAQVEIAKTGARNSDGATVGASRNRP